MKNYLFTRTSKQINNLIVPKARIALPSLDRSDSVEAALAVVIVHHELEVVGHAVALTRTFFFIKRHLQSCANKRARNLRCWLAEARDAHASTTKPEVI